MVLEIVIADNFLKSFNYDVKFEKCYIHIYYNSRDAPTNPVKHILNDFNTQTSDNDHIVISDRVTDFKLTLIGDIKRVENKHVIIRSKKKTLTIGQSLLLDVPLYSIPYEEQAILCCGRTFLCITSFII
jgi:hypothetical protein